MGTVATLVPGPGAGPQLQPWPLLVWLPGVGVCTEDHRIPVADVSRRAAETTPEHISQALSYLRSQPAEV